MGFSINGSSYFGVQISGELDVARNALIQLATRLKANSFEREGALPALMPPVPYISFAGDSSDMMKYGSREGKGYGRGYSSYSSLDVDAEGYSGYGASQVRIFFFFLVRFVSDSVFPFLPF